VQFSPRKGEVVIGAETRSNTSPGGFAGEVVVCNSETGEISQRIVLSERFAAGALSRDGTLMAVSSRVGPTVEDPQKYRIQIWDLITGRLQFELGRIDDPVLHMTFATDDKSLWFVCNDKSIRQLSISDRTRPERVFTTSLGTSEERASIAVFLPDTHRVITGSTHVDEGGIRTGEFSATSLAVDHHSTSQQLKTFDWSFVGLYPTLMCVSPDAKEVAAYFRRTRGFAGPGLIIHWSLEEARTLHQFPVEDGHVTSFVFSPDGTRLVSGMDRGDALVWDIAAIKKAN
jgi:WD40 repeat protein